MTKNIITLLAAVLFSGLVAFAQHAPGTWRTFPMLGNNFDRVVDTPSKVYYLTGGSLYSYDKADKETVYYSPGEMTSNYGIQKMFYNPYGKYLLLTYADSSMDLLYDDGRLVNLPDITNANLLTTKAIRDVAFAPGKIYVATDFGMVIFDDKDHYVLESGIYSLPFDLIMEAAGQIFVKHSGRIYSSPVGERHKSFDSFRQSDLNANVIDWAPVGTDTFIYAVANQLYKATVDASSSSVSATSLSGLAGVSIIEPAASDSYFAVGTNSVLTITPSLEVTATAIPANLKSHRLASWDGVSSVWAANAAGIGCFDITSSTPVVKMEKYLPDGCLKFGVVNYVPTPDGDIYLANLGDGRFYSPSSPYGKDAPIMTVLYNWNTDEFKDVSPLLDNGSTINQGPINTLVDPVDPEILYTVTLKSGLNVYKNRKLLHVLNETQIPIDKTWTYWLMGLFFDPDGNMWLADQNNSSYRDCPEYYILPASKIATLRTSPGSIKKTDWLQAQMPHYSSDDRRYMLAFSSRKNPTRAFHMTDYGNAYVGYDTKGTLTTEDDEAVASNGLYTQDGNNVHFSTNNCLVEDKNGHFWIGTSEGVLVITDIDQLGHTSEIQVVRPKVARNDGTVYADYLLSTDRINHISVDPTNRKWISTQASGLFLVNEDGTEILANFTKDNSPLVTNDVYSTYCSPDGNDILISTPAGLMLYSGTSAPAADDYSDVFAYPNPVRPDYTGWITVQGLMDNSLVKIADAQGNVVASGRSEGGMFVWDGCNNTGQRVRSGVYMVLASQSDGSDSSGAVTRIVVIN